MPPFAASLLPLLLSTASLAAPLPSSAPIDADLAPSTFMDALQYGNAPTWVLRASWQRSDEAARVALVEAAFRWARAFVASEQFAGHYRQVRELARPVEPVLADTGFDPAAQQQAADEMIATMRAALEHAPPDQREEVEKAIRDIEASMQEMREDVELQAAQQQFAEAELAAAREQHASDLARFEHDYPAEPGRLVARRLQQFVDTCGDVDFTAGLAGRRFADPQVEARSHEWKLCYRAGSAPVGRALQLARQWLAELPHSG